MSRIGVLVLVAATAAFAASAARYGTVAQTQVRASMLAAASAKHSVHYVSTSSAKGHFIKIVGDVGPKAKASSGSQSRPAASQAPRPC